MTWRYKGSTDVTIDVWIADSSSSVGAGLTGLAYDSASLVCYYRRGATGSATPLSLATQTVDGAHSDGGFVEISSANMPGMYRLDLEDAICASGVDEVSIELKGAANMVPVPIRLELRDTPWSHRGTAQSGGSDKVRLATTASTTADFHNGQVAYIRSGTGAGQSRVIIDYTTDRDAYVYVAGASNEGRAWDFSPDNTSVIEIYPLPGFMPASIELSGQNPVADLSATALSAITTELTSNFLPAITQCRRGVAFTLPFEMVDATDLHTAEPGKTVTVEVSIDDAAFAPATNSATEVASGAYNIALTTTEMDSTRTRVKVSATGCATRIYTLLPAPAA